MLFEPRFEYGTLGLRAHAIERAKEQGKVVAIECFHDKLVVGTCNTHIRCNSRGQRGKRVSIRFDDETIGIEWPVATEQLLLSDKAGHAVSFKDAVYYE